MSGRSTVSALEGAFERARAEGRAALIPYVMAWHPAPGEDVELARALAAGGADLIEVGMPFSDPLADGPTIQAAATASLAQGATVGAALQTAGRIREATGLPVAMMGYWNPVLRYGVERFCRDAATAGVEGLILPDLPPEEAEEGTGPYTLDGSPENAGGRAPHRGRPTGSPLQSCSEGESPSLRTVAASCGLHLVTLVAPTSTEDRLRKAAAVASGFVYCVSLAGVTGARESVSAGLPEFLARVRRHTPLPLAVGFGISRPEHARSVARVADGVVVASALLDLVGRTARDERFGAVEAYARSLRDAARRESSAADEEWPTEGEGDVMAVAVGKGTRDGDE